LKRNGTATPLGDPIESPALTQSFPEGNGGKAFLRPIGFGQKETSGNLTAAAEIAA